MKKKRVVYGYSGQGGRLGRKGANSTNDATNDWKFQMVVYFKPQDVNSTFQNSC